jgi:hypothetical protein
VRIPLAALAASVALAGCPLPQPLPDYPAGTITPPRILVDAIAVDGVPSNAQAVVLVPASCPGPEPTYPLTAEIYDTNTLEQVEARWFVNYSPSQLVYYTAWQSDTIPPDPDPLVLTRTVPPRDPDTGEERPFQFRPYDYRPPAGAPAGVGPKYPEAGIVRVAELVVSNGFDPDAVEPPDAALPQRTPLPGFETQVYRWVFLTVPESVGSCAAGDPGCVKCPTP